MSLNGYWLTFNIRVLKVGFSLYIHRKISKVRKKYTIWKIISSNLNKQTILERKCWRIVYAKKQKIISKKKSQRSFRAFISIVKWYKNKFDVALYISNIYGNECQKKEVNIRKLPLWRDITNIQKLAYFFYFMAETKKFTNVKPFTLDFSKQFRDR